VVRAPLQSLQRHCMHVPSFRLPRTAHETAFDIAPAFLLPSVPVGPVGLPTAVLPDPRFTNVPVCPPAAARTMVPASTATLSVDCQSAG
jgi:hypothetical protein